MNILQWQAFQPLPSQYIDMGTSFSYYRMRSTRSSSTFLNSHQMLPSKTPVMQSAIGLALLY